MSLSLAEDYVVVAVAKHMSCISKQDIHPHQSEGRQLRDYLLLYILRSRSYCLHNEIQGILCARKS